MFAVFEILRDVFKQCFQLRSGKGQMMNCDDLPQELIYSVNYITSVFVVHLCLLKRRNKVLCGPPMYSGPYTIT